MDQLTSMVNSMNIDDVLKQEIIQLTATIVSNENAQLDAVPKISLPQSQLKRLIPKPHETKPMMQTCDWIYPCRSTSSPTFIGSAIGSIHER